MYSEGGLVVFDNCKIVGIGDPTKFTPIDGAIVFSKMTASRVVLTSCVMSKIYALNGGVIYMIYGSVAIVDCTMSAIDASNSGGIIYQALHGSASIDNCTMTGISAGTGRSGKGGLVYAERSVTLTNCTASDVFAVRRERHHARFSSLCLLCALARKRLHWHARAGSSGQLGFGSGRGALLR